MEKYNGNFRRWVEIKIFGKTLPQIRDDITLYYKGKTLTQWRNCWCQAGQLGEEKKDSSSSSLGFLPLRPPGN